jgi:hypothetical protein
MKTVIADTCFWIGLFIDNDMFHRYSTEYYISNIDAIRLIFPWPSMYETLRTQFVRNYNAVARLEKEMKRTNIVKYGDRSIKNKALEEMFKLNLYHGYKLSLTDTLIREIIKSGRSNISGLITSNRSDFIDICQLYKVDLIEMTQN